MGKSQRKINPKIIKRKSSRSQSCIAPSFPMPDVILRVTFFLAVLFGIFHTYGYSNKSPSTKDAANGNEGIVCHKYSHPQDYTKIEDWTFKIPSTELGSVRADTRKPGFSVFTLNDLPFIDFLHKDPVSFYARVSNMRITQVAVDRSIPFQSHPYAKQGFGRTVCKLTGFPYSHWKMYMRVDDNESKEYAWLCFQRRCSRISFEECQGKWVLGRTEDDFIDVPSPNVMQVQDFADEFSGITEFSRGTWWVPGCVGGGKGRYVCHDLIWDGLLKLGIHPIPGKPDIMIPAGDELTVKLRLEFERARFDKTPTNVRSQERTPTFCWDVEVD